MVPSFLTASYKFQHGENRAKSKDNSRGIWVHERNKKEAASRGGKESEEDKEVEEVEEEASKAPRNPGANRIPRALIPLDTHGRDPHMDRETDDANRPHRQPVPAYQRGVQP